MQSQTSKIKPTANLYPWTCDTAYLRPWHLEWFTYLTWTLIYSTRERQDTGDTEVNNTDTGRCVSKHTHTTHTHHSMPGAPTWDKLHFVSLSFLIPSSLTTPRTRSTSHRAISRQAARSRKGTPPLLFSPSSPHSVLASSQAASQASVSQPH